MALPTSRDITILAGSSQIPASLLNDLQDQIIGAKKPALVRPQVLFPFSSSLFNMSTAPGGIVPYAISTGAGVATFGVACETGERITSFTFRALGNGVVDCTTTLYAVNQDMVTTAVLGSFADINRAAAWGEVTLAGPFVPHIMAAGEFLVLQALPNAANYQIGRGLLGYDRL